MSTAPARSTGPAKVDWLAQLRTVVKSKPTAAVIYGVPGIGKSSMAAAAPSPVFITGPLDRGIETLKSSGQVGPEVGNFDACKSWADVLSQIDTVATGEHDRKTLVLDNIGDIELLCHDEVIRRDFDGKRGNDGFLNYQAGPRVAASDIRMMITAIDRCRDRGMSALLIGHCAQREVKNPFAANYDKMAPDCHKETWGVISKWADMILFLNSEVHVVGVKDDMKKGKARGGQNRVMYCNHHATYEAKNRHNLPDEIPMGNSGPEAWGNLVNAIKEGRANNG